MTPEKDGGTPVGYTGRNIVSGVSGLSLYHIGNRASTCTLYIGDTVTALPYGFAINSGITDVVFQGNDIEIIPFSAFSNNERLTSIVIPEGVRYIQWEAFAGCPALVDITLPDSLESITTGKTYSTSTTTHGAFYLDSIYSSSYNYDRDSDGTDDALTTTLHCSDDNMVARTYRWLSKDNRYVANAISVAYTVTIPATLELTDPGNGVFVNDMPVGVVVNEDLDSPLSVELSMGAFKNAADTKWNLELSQTTPTEIVQTAGDYSFDCVVSGIPVSDGVFSGNLTCTVTE